MMNITAIFINQEYNELCSHKHCGSTGAHACMTLAGPTWCAGGLAGWACTCTRLATRRRARCIIIIIYAYTMCVSHEVYQIWHANCSTWFVQDGKFKGEDKNVTTPRTITSSQIGVLQLSPEKEQYQV